MDLGDHRVLLKPGIELRPNLISVLEDPDSRSDEDKNDGSAEVPGRSVVLLALTFIVAFSTLISHGK